MRSAPAIRRAAAGSADDERPAHSRRRIARKSMKPEVGVSIRLRHRRNVLLPEPLAPMIDTTSPSWISREIPFRTSLAP